MGAYLSPSPGSFAVASERYKHLKEGKESGKEGERERQKMEEERGGIKGAGRRKTR